MEVKQPEIIRIVLTGGVSGGHTYPLIAVTEAARKKYPAPLEFLYIGPYGKIESEAMEEAGIPTKYVATGKWRRYFSFLNFVDLFRLPFGFLQALWYLLWYMPDAIFAKGGSASIPVVLAAWVYRIPIIIHDSDAVAGKANRFLATFVDRIAIAYEGAFKYFPREKTGLTGNPVRNEIMNGDAGRALDTLALKPTAPLLLVIGGSQGARIINEHLLAILPGLLEKGHQVVHVTGENNYDAVAQATREYGLDIEKGPYRPVPYLNSQGLADVYAAAQVVLSRAGANSIAELAANKKAVILVPLSSSANDEQRMNAYELAEHGAVKVLEEANLTEHLVIENLDELLTNKELRERMGESLYPFYHPEAADRIAETLIQLALA